MALTDTRRQNNRDRRIRRRGLEITNVLQTRGREGLDRDSAKQVIEIADAVIREAKTELTGDDNEWLQMILVERPDTNNDRSPYSFSMEDLLMTFPTWKKIRPWFAVWFAVAGILLLANLIVTGVSLVN